jgi:hypothetical protein
VDSPPVSEQDYRSVRWVLIPLPPVSLLPLVVVVVVVVLLLLSSSMSMSSD